MRNLQRIETRGDVFGAGVLDVNQKEGFWTTKVNMISRRTG